MDGFDLSLPKILGKDLRNFCHGEIFVGHVTVYLFSHECHVVELSLFDETGGKMLLGACCFSGKNLPHFRRGGS